MAKYHGKKVANLKNVEKAKKRDFLIVLLTGGCRSIYIQPILTRLETHKKVCSENIG